MEFELSGEQILRRRLTPKRFVGSVFEREGKEAESGRGRCGAVMRHQVRPQVTCGSSEAGMTLGKRPELGLGD